MTDTTLDARTITPEWLATLPYQIVSTFRAPTIEGVVTRRLKANLDGRGEVTELWSAPWMRDGFIRADHVYQSATDYSVTKCWHLHNIHTDQFVVTRGKLQVSVVDIRPESPTFGHADVFIVGSLNPMLIKIPPGLLHGWKALSRPEVIVFNLQSHLFDPGDEYKFPWDCVLREIWEPKNG